MGKMVFSSMAMTIVSVATLHAAPPVVTEFSVDTSLYDFSNYGVNNYAASRFIAGPFVNSNEGNILFCRAYKKKDSDQIDFFSFNGLFGTSILPVSGDPHFQVVIFSQTFIDEDPAWEAIVRYLDVETTWENYFKVFDDNGTELLSDTGYAEYGFDGYSTYVVVRRANLGYKETKFKSWRFRTNISSVEEPSFKKRARSTPPAMMTYGLSDGSYRVTLLPSNGGKTTMQMFDLTGRCLFSREIERLTEPVSFTIPEDNVPRTPFIAKVKNRNGVSYEKELPVR